MIINSFEFLWIFPIIFIIYIFITGKTSGNTPVVANYFLLISSYCLFYYYNALLTLILFEVTIVTYYGAIIWNKCKYKKTIIITVILLASLPLLTFKYKDFVLDNLSHLVGDEIIFGAHDRTSWAIPLGISFFTLQALGYYLDVIKGKISVEYNLADYMLFVAFFPQVISGPISEAQDLLPQIKSKRCFSYDRAVEGLKWLLWGMFLKVVVGDRLGSYITEVQINSGLYSKSTIIISVVLYSFQIYCDFAGYSFMAMGVGKLLGFDLINNFERPYFAISITDFWHRWHISLSKWLKNHIYIPLGGSRCSSLRNSLNIFITFLVSGLWHGANWTFVVWGGMHGMAQVIEKKTGWNKKTTGLVINLIRMVITFILVTLAWVFFVQSDINLAFATIKNMFISEGTKQIDFTVPCLLCGVILLKDIGEEYNVKALIFFNHKSRIVRWSTYTILMTSIMCFAVYGEKFIYAGF